MDLDNLSSPSFDDYFSNIELFPLELTDESLLQEVDKQIWHNNKIYILDSRQKLIFVFDREGSFIKKIDKRGSGPGEYSDLIDLQINPFTDDLELLSPMSGILKYDSLGENYKGYVELPPTVKVAHDFVSVSQNVYLYFCMARKGNKMVAYNTDKDEIVADLYEMPHFLYFSTLYKHSYNPFYILDRKVHFIQSYNGDVFTFEDGKLHPKYQWDFGKYNFDIGELESDKDIPYYMNHYKTIGSKHATKFIAYVENSQYYITQFSFKLKNCTLIYDKHENQSVVFTSSKEGHRLIPTYIDESAVYCLVKPQVIPAIFNREELSEENQRIYDSITLESNPVIVKYTFK